MYVIIIQNIFNGVKIMSNKITVIGPGRWGSFIAWYLDSLKYNVTLYGRSSSRNLKEIQETKKNEYVKFNDSLKITSSLDDALKSDIIIISIDSQGLRNLMIQIQDYNLKNKIFCLCMKGIEISSHKRLSEVVEEFIDPSCKVAVWLGPGHIQEFVKKVPNCMIIDSKDDNVKEKLIKLFSSDLIRFYYGTDLIGNEIGAASKNVIGIAAGFLDGANLTTLKGALMSRGTREVARLIKAMGGNELSAYGLCHLGDYEATVFSEFSHNRMYGEKFIKHEPYDKLAEGYYTVKALMQLSEKYHVEMPITKAVYNILYLNKDGDKEIKELFSRSLKKEF